MTRNSSPEARAPAPARRSEPGRTEVRDLNRRMAERISHDPAQPLSEGSVSLRVIRTLGRKSGRWRSTPIGVLLLQDRFYAVCPDARRNWVGNLDQNSHCLLGAGGEELSANAVVANDTAAILAVRAYLAAADVPWAISAFPVKPTAPDDVIRAHLPQMAVFELCPDNGTWLR